MIIDAHTHLPLRDGVPPGSEGQRDQYLADLKGDGVDHAILIPDNVEGSPIGDLDTCLHLFKDVSNVSVLGVIDIQSEYSDRLAKLDSLIQKRKIVGVKLFPGHDPIYPTDKRLTPVYEMCRRYDIPAMIHTGQNSNASEAAAYNDPKYIVEVAKRYPTLKIVIAHYFWPKLDYCYKLTRGCPNIFFDTSALADKEVIAATGQEVIRQVLQQTIADSSDSVIFGSDYLSCERAPHLDLVNSLGLSPLAQARVLWKNAARLFGIRVDGAD